MTESETSESHEIENSMQDKGIKSKSKTLHSIPKNVFSLSVSVVYVSGLSLPPPLVFFFVDQ